MINQHSLTSESSSLQSSSSSIPPSLLISSNPYHASRLLFNHHQPDQLTKTNLINTHHHHPPYSINNSSYFHSRRQPPSKRPRHSKNNHHHHQKTQTTIESNHSSHPSSFSSPLSSQDEPTPESLTNLDKNHSQDDDENDDRKELEGDDDNDEDSNQEEEDDEELLPALPSLPPTPLTPQEIIQSATLSRIFKKSNRTFPQISDSATSLIEADLKTCNQLTDLVELLRGDLNSRTWIQLVENLIQKRHQQSDPNHQPSSNGQSQQQQQQPDSTSHYQVLTQTLETVQSLFISPSPITIPSIPNTSEETHHLHHKKTNRSMTSNSTELSNTLNQPLETLTSAEQVQIYEACSVQLTRFLGDLKDYRDRLLEITNGCLAIEKRRRAIWALIKICSAGFEESCQSTPNNNNNT